MILSLAYMFVNMIQCAGQVAGDARGREITQTAVCGYRIEEGKRIHYCRIALGTDAKVKRAEILSTEGEARTVVSSEAGAVRYSDSDERTFEVDIPLDGRLAQGKKGIRLRFCFDDKEREDIDSVKSWIYNQQAEQFYRCHNFGHSAPDRPDN